MAPWLGTCTDLAEGQSSIPSTHIGSSQLPLTLVPGDLLPISGLHRHCICMLACTHLQTHNLKIKVFKGEGGRGERKPRHGGVSSLFLLSLFLTVNFSDLRSRKQRENLVGVRFGAPSAPVDEPSLTVWMESSSQGCICVKAKYQMSQRSDLPVYQDHPGRQFAALPCSALVHTRDT